MLKHTKKIREMYEEIQRQIFYLLPEKWEELYLYASVIDNPKDDFAGEMFLYYIPKGIFKKKPVNIYEVPAKFNIQEKEYLTLVENLYRKIKELREEFKKIELGETWSNITISIHDITFRVEYNYMDLPHSVFSSYERHIVWRYEYLGIGMEQVNKKEKQVLKRYFTGPKTLERKEIYESGIYIKEVKNEIDYEKVPEEQKQEEVIKPNNKINEENKTKKRNQILFSNDE